LEVGNLVLQNPPKRKPPKATMKPYSDSSNMIQKSIRRNFLSYINSRLSATPEGQGNEVLLFSVAHFLFFSFHPSNTKRAFIFLYPLMSVLRINECYHQHLNKFAF